MKVIANQKFKKLQNEIIKQFDMNFLNSSSSIPLSLNEIEQLAENNNINISGINDFKD